MIRIEIKKVPREPLESPRDTTTSIQHRALNCTMGALGRRATTLWILLIGGISLLAGLPSQSAAAAITFGDGPDSVFLVIEHPEFGPNPFLYEYRFASPLYTEPVEEPSDFANLLRGDQILQALIDNPPVTAQGQQHHWAVDDVDFVQEFTLAIDQQDPVSVFADFNQSESWVQWASGSFYWYTLSGGDEYWGEHPAGPWSQGFGNAATYLPPGSSIGWTLGTYDFDAEADTFNLIVDSPSAIPEPMAGLLFLGGAGLLTIVRRRCISRG